MPGLGAIAQGGYLRQLFEAWPENLSRGHKTHQLMTSDTGYAYPLLLYPGKNGHLSSWTIINLLIDVLQQPLKGK
jgi:hypothetical protein